MLIAIGTPEQVGEGWIPFPPTITMPPWEIRQKLRHLTTADEARLNADPEAPEIQIVTMNRTVLDQVLWADHKNHRYLSYGDVSVWHEGRLVPLLDFHDAEWLVNFSLGNLYERGALIPSGIFPPGEE